MKLKRGISFFSLLLNTNKLRNKLEFRLPKIINLDAMDVTNSVQQSIQRKNYNHGRIDLFCCLMLCFLKHYTLNYDV